MFLNDYDARDEKAGVNIKLKDIYTKGQLPHYIWRENVKENGDIDELLKEYIYEFNKNKMLLILGQPGIGKSTLITWLINNYIEIEKDILVYRVASDLKNIDWRDKVRNFKIFLWIFVIFLVQTVVLSPIHIFGAVPSAVLAFVMCVEILENEFRTAVIISGICAVVMGAIGGRNFTEITLFYAYSSIIVFAARKRPRYVGNFPKTIVWTFIMSAILEILLFVIREMTLDVSVIFSDALPTAVFNTVIAVILYPILKKTLYKEEKKKKLLIA